MSFVWVSYRRMMDTQYYKDKHRYQLLECPMSVNPWLDSYQSNNLLWLYGNCEQMAIVSRQCRWIIYGPLVFEKITQNVKISFLIK